MPTIRVLHFGLGPIGLSIVKQVSQRPGLKIVGAIDIDPAKAGRDLGEVAGLKKRLGVRVQTDAAKALKAARPHVVIHCTSSSLERVMPQLEAILASKAAIVSTTEELAYPFRMHASTDQTARRPGKKVEGCRSRHRRQPRFCDGRSPDCAERGLRAGRRGCRQSDTGRAHAPAAIPAENRRGPHARAVCEEGEGSQRAPRRLHAVDCDDWRRAWLEAGSHHRRDQTQDRRP